jgi:CTP synthase (UTP-ammonia lyase)
VEFEQANSVHLARKLVPKDMHGIRVIEIESCDSRDDSSTAVHSNNGDTHSMNEPVQVGIIGDFNPQLRYHRVTNEALHQAGRSLSVEVNCVWLPTDSLDEAQSEASLERCDALWCAPGSPYTSMEGALKGIQFAREKDRPFVGT